MEWERISANWSHWRDRVRERWSRLSELELTAIAGRRDQLAARIQDTYGLSPEETERQLLNWERNLSIDEFDSLAGMMGREPK